MRKEDVALRLKRVLQGSRNVEDLNRLFNWLRFRSHGDPIIAEIGHFAAHQDKRDQGIAWQRAKLIYQNARFFFAAMQVRRLGKAIDIKAQHYHEALAASLELLGPRQIHSDLRLGMKKAKRLLAMAIETMEAKGVNALAGQEKRLVEHLQSRFSPNHVFDQAQLRESLSGLLVKERLLDEREIPALHEQMDFIAMYVISIMHLCEVDLGDGQTCVLRAAHNPAGLLVIAAAFPEVAPKVELGTTMFSTECKPDKWCNPACEADYSKIFTWQDPIELDELGRLKEMT